EAKSVATKFLHDFAGEGYIVAPSGSCTGFVRNYYGDMFDNRSDHKLSIQVRNNVYEFSEFLVKMLNVSDIGASFEGKATYHDACGALRECGIKEAPRKLLAHV